MCLLDSRVSVSYVWYSSLGVATVLLVGLLTSLLFPRDPRTLERRLLSPCLETLYQVNIP